MSSFFAFLLLLTATSVAAARAGRLSSPPQLENDVSSLCYCDMFIQSKKSSGFVRLPTGLQTSLPITMNSSADDTCLLTCQEKFPLSDSSFWGLVNKQVCKALLMEQEAPTSGKGVRATLQAYYRRAPDAWRPMGAAYRRTLSCKAPRTKRSTKNSRKISNSKFNSIDAQSVVSRPVEDGEKMEVTPAPSSVEETKRPVLLDMGPLQMALKRFSVLAPYVDGLFGTAEPVNVRDLLDGVRLGGVVDRYYHAYDHFADEVDAARCTFEYVIYSAFNQRLGAKDGGGDSGALSRGFQEEAVGALMDLAASFLRSDNSSDVIRDVWNLMPAREDHNSLNGLNDPEEESNAVPDVMEVAKTIGRFYLRSYFDSLGSTKSSAPSPTSDSASDSASSAQQLANRIDTPDSLADMVEQVSKPFFLSIFGVVPGLPASGRLDRRLLDLNSEDDDDIDDDFDSASTENRIKLEPMHDALPPTNHKTGNVFFDVGNSFFGTLQRANDATHSLFCAKQYMVNKVWEQFRHGVRKLMRSIPV